MKCGECRLFASGDWCPLGCKNVYDSEACFPMKALRRLDKQTENRVIDEAKKEELDRIRYTCGACSGLGFIGYSNDPPHGVVLCGVCNGTGNNKRGLK
jgi:hypothetical protein